MTIRFACPACGQGLAVDSEHIGKTKGCPKCGVRIRIPGNGLVDRPPPTEVAYAASPEAPVETIVVPPAVHFHEQPRGANSLGIASIVLGVVALPFMRFPPISVSLAGLGLILAIAGLLFAFNRHGTGIGFAIAGGAISCVSLGVTMLVAIGLFTLRGQAAFTVVDAPGPGRLGEFEVTIEKISVSKPPGSKGHFSVRLKFTNASPDRKFAYGMAGGPTLDDLHGNHYRTLSRGSLDSMMRSASGVALYPGDSTQDTFVFETPVATVEEVRLHVPGKLVSQKGELAFKIPRSLWSNGP